MKNNDVIVARNISNDIKVILEELREY